MIPCVSIWMRALADALKLLNCKVASHAARKVAFKKYFFMGYVLIHVISFIV